MFVAGRRFRADRSLFPYSAPEVSGRGLPGFANNTHLCCRHTQADLFGYRAVCVGGGEGLLMRLWRTGGHSSCFIWLLLCTLRVQGRLAPHSLGSHSREQRYTQPSTTTPTLDEPAILLDTHGGRYSPHLPAHQQKVMGRTYLLCANRWYSTRRWDWVPYGNYKWHTWIGCKSTKCVVK